MFFKNIVFFFFFFLFRKVLCVSDTAKIYDEFVNSIVNNTKKLTTRIKSELGDSDEAIKMLDAWSKIPSGLLEGHFIDLGSFDECYGIDYNNIYGKYCLGKLKPSSENEKYFKIFGYNASKPQPRLTLHPQPRLVGLGAEYAGIHFAACVPSSVPAAEITGIFTYTEDFCYSKATKPEMSAGGIVTITILAIFLCLIVVSTSYDIALNYFKKEPYHELFIAFSFLHNGRKLFRSSKNQDQLLCLNGIKALSMLWVIIGHEYSSGGNAPFSNLFGLYYFRQDSANMFITGATVSVDTFFVVGGLVTVYTFMKSMDKGAKFNIVLFYVHRYLRLTPIYVILSLIHLFLLDHFGNGPLWKVVDLVLVDTCQEGWWSSFLYITNYVQKGACLPQTWYLSVDMQLFVLSPLILIPLYKWPKIGLGNLGFLIIAGCIVPFALGYATGLNGTMVNQKNEDFSNIYYIQTYARFGPYVIGMLVGYYLYKIKKADLKIQLRWWLVVVLWLVILTGLVACVYAGFPLTITTDEDKWGNSMYLGFNRPAWAVAVSGAIVLCVSGYGGPIDKFLSLPVFQFLTKLSYSMYLVHYSVITVRYAVLRNNVKFSHLSLMHAFWGDFMITLGLSLVFCLAFESPIIILEKYLFHKDTAKKTTK
ncbi:nose resistant to fluoxetine protein 6-like [Tribolium castaneum]|uniref:nose resistant to fluoxetine protein 6-like n=1 Tax=Tribolium castaneum TaxID=7070 RepID=UPI00046BF7A5